MAESKTKKKSLVLAIFAIALRSTFDLGFMAFQFSPIVVMFSIVLKTYNDKRLSEIA